MDLISLRHRETNGKAKREAVALPGRRIIPPDGAQAPMLENAMIFKYFQQYGGNGQTRSSSTTLLATWTVGRDTTAAVATHTTHSIA